MKKFFLIFILALSFLLPINASADEPKFKVAIVPYILPTSIDIGLAVDGIHGKPDWYTEPFDTEVEKKFMEKFNSPRYELVPKNEIIEALSKYGYDVSGLDLPEKSDIIAMAKDLKADGIVAVEITRFAITFGLPKFNVSYKLRAYDVKKDKYLSFSTAYTTEEFRLPPFLPENFVKEKLRQTISIALDKGLSKLSF